jgi:PAS domain S-box-containing protein
LIPVGENFVEAVRAVPRGEHAAAGLRGLLAGTTAEYGCDLCVDEAAGVWIRLLAARDPAGAGSVLVMVAEITNHPAARAGKENEERLDRIVESAMDGIVTIDEHGRVVMFNGAAEAMFGVKAAEALGGTLDRFLPMQTRGVHGRLVAGFGRTGVSSRGMGNLGSVMGIRADGKEFAIEASISQAKVEGKQFFTAILRDVSERKKLEAQLLQSQKMEGVGRLAGGIAHDFNNLLMAIFNYLALATRKLGAEHPAAGAIAQANMAAQRAADLTRQLLTFARIHAVSPRVLNPAEVVKGLTPMLHRLIGEDIELRTALRAETGNIKADPAQLEQVIVNLVVNSRDAMPGGGTLTIETRNEDLDEAYCRTRVEATPGEHVVLSVTDTGSGMTPEVQSKIFEPFFTTKPVGKGTGLGLATCHGIAKQSGGHIGVYSEPGRGTSIRVYFPRMVSEASAAEALRPVAAAPGGTETILLAEDSGLVRELLASELREAGYEVLTAENGGEALRVAESFDGTIHLLLTDIVMPEVNGVQLAERLCGVGGGRAGMKVIFMSGYTEETISHHGVDPGRVPFLAKPCMTRELLELIHRVLRGDWGGE